MNENANLVPVATFSFLPEAEVARTLLEAEGIEAVVQDEVFTSLMPPVAMASGGVTLLVAPEELERAGALLAAAPEGDSGLEAEYDDDVDDAPAPPAEASGDGAVV